MVRKRRLQEEEEAEKEEEKAVLMFKEMKRPNKRKKDDKQRSATAKKFKMEEVDVIPKGWKSREAHPVLGGEASHGQTSFKVTTGDCGDVKSPDGDAIPGCWKPEQAHSEPGGEAQDEPIPGMEATFAPEGWRERADSRLSELRARMKKESQSIINYMDLKRLDETLITIRELWIEPVMEHSLEAGKQVPTFNQTVKSTVDKDLSLADWQCWWRRMEGEADSTRRLERKRVQAEKATFFKDRIQPNLSLTGWTTWWSRMEAERRKEEKLISKNPDWTFTRTYTNNLMKSNFVRRFYSSTNFPNKAEVTSEKYTAEVNIKCGQSPKRKMNFDTICQGSPSKMRKTFSQNLSYWKTLESIEQQTVSTDFALQYFKKNSNSNSKNSHTQLNKVDVVNWREIPDDLPGDPTSSDTPN